MENTGIRSWVRIDSEYDGEQVFIYDEDGIVVTTKLRSIYFDRSVGDIVDILEGGMFSEPAMEARMGEVFYKNGSMWYSVIHRLEDDGGSRFRNYCFTVYRKRCIMLNSVICSCRALQMFDGLIKLFIDGMDIDAVVDESGILIDSGIKVKVWSKGKFNYNCNSTPECLLFTNDVQYASIGLCRDEDSSKVIFDCMLNGLSSSMCEVSFLNAGFSFNGEDYAAYAVNAKGRCVGYITYFKKPVSGRFVYVFLYSTAEQAHTCRIDELFGIEVVA